MSSEARFYTTPHPIKCTQSIPIFERKWAKYSERKSAKKIFIAGKQMPQLQSFPQLKNTRRGTDIAKHANLIVSWALILCFIFETFHHLRPEFPSGFSFFVFRLLLFSSPFSFVQFYQRVANETSVWIIISQAVYVLQNFFNGKRNGEKFHWREMEIIINYYTFSYHTYIHIQLLLMVNILMYFLAHTNEMIECVGYFDDDSRLNMKIKCR